MAHRIGSCVVQRKSPETTRYEVGRFEFNFRSPKLWLCLVALGYRRDGRVMLAALLLAATVVVVPANPSGGPVIEETRYAWINGVYQRIQIVTQDGKLLLKRKIRPTDDMDRGGPVFDDWNGDR